MSNSIWHKLDGTPKDFCDVVLANFETGTCCVCFPPFHNVSFNCDRWAYLTDIIAQADKAERLQKAVDCAVEELQRVAGDEDIDWLRAESARTTIDEIKQLTQGSK